MDRRAWLLHRIREYEQKTTIKGEDLLGKSKKAATIEELESCYKLLWHEYHPELWNIV